MLQVNIRSWTANKYTFLVDISNYNPDIILLNETSAFNNSIKVNGYYIIQSCKERFSGVAILIKLGLNFNILPTRDENTLAVKVMTSISPIIISTSYIPPRLQQTFRL